MDTHKFEVHQISKQIKSFHAQQNPFNIHHGATYSSRIRPDPQAVVLTTHLDHILEVNTSSQYTIVEPNVSLDQLLKKTLKHGLMPPVVPHFPGLTVGGCFAGTAGSSSSFRQGFFDEAISWAEIVLPDGNVTIASRTQGADLLSGMVGSLGSIGVATLFQIKLVPATHWVELTYVPVKTVDEAVETISTLCQEANNDFVEGLVYGPKASTYGVIAVGKLVEGKEHPQVGFSKPNDDWFYQHALAAGGSPRTESITTTDYLFRHDRGTFCMGRYCFGNMPFNKLTRCITDSATRSHALTKTSHELDWPEHFIQQDVVVPLEKSWEMINFLDGTLRIYPLSLCPVRQWPDNRISKSL
jgi:delta24-sterol reductase